jgi:thymidylate synthase (FAD)
LRHGHTSPFEQVVMTFHAKMPIFVARQWVRHRTARLNELSGRYSVMSDEFYVPDADQVRAQSQTNRQGRESKPVGAQLAREVTETMAGDQRSVYRNYEQMIESGIARELARINLPLALYTQWYWQIDLHNLFNFLRLRLDEHAQYEIRQYAQAIARCARAVAPVAYEAFEEHVLEGARLSRAEVEAARAMSQGRPCPIKDARRRGEFFDKMGMKEPEKKDKD